MGFVVFKTEEEVIRAVDSKQNVMIKGRPASLDRSGEFSSRNDPGSSSFYSHFGTILAREML